MMSPAVAPGSSYRRTDDHDDVGVESEAQMEAPLIDLHGDGGGSMNGGGGGTTTRRRGGGGVASNAILEGGGNDQQQHQHQDGFYASSFDPHPPQSQPQPRRPLLRSLTPGGYGPVSPGSFDRSDPGGGGYDGGKDGKGRKWYNRLHSATCNVLRRCGCSGHEMLLEEGPLGKYYRDDFNDESWGCNPGTGEENGIWMNTRDQAGTIMALMVWFLLGYSAVTVTLLAETGGVPPGCSMAYCVVSSLALACHAKTTFTDPGSVPQSAVPVESLRHRQRRQGRRERPLSMCSQCQTFKPPFSHHCRICNRCISRMDHHCPWMNNCIGAANLKHFILFLLYTWLCSAFSLLLLGWNYFFCADERCTFTPVLIQLVRVMTVLSVGSFLFTSSMIMNVCYGLLTGIGTIDRLKKKATNTVHEATEEPIPLRDVFGIAGYHTWPLPIDPVFPDYDRVMGYSTPQRLLREQMKENPDAGGGAGGGGGAAPSVISRASFLPAASEHNSNFYGQVV